MHTITTNIGWEETEKQTDRYIYRDRLPESKPAVLMRWSTNRETTKRSQNNSTSCWRISFHCTRVLLVSTTSYLPPIAWSAEWFSMAVPHRRRGSLYHHFWPLCFRPSYVGGEDRGSRSVRPCGRQIWRRALEGNGRSCRRVKKCNRETESGNKGPWGTWEMTSYTILGPSNPVNRGTIARLIAAGNVGAPRTERKKKERKKAIMNQCGMTSMLTIQQLV